MKILSECMKWYFYITTSILMVVAVIFTLYGVEPLPSATLWQILLSGLATTLITVIFGELDKKFMLGKVLKYFLHYMLLSVVMISLGVWFGWLDLKPSGIIMMLGAVAVVYALAFGAYYIVDLRAAKKINQGLKKKYGNE